MSDPTSSESEKLLWLSIFNKISLDVIILKFKKSCLGIGASLKDHKPVLTVLILRDMGLSKFYLEPKSAGILTFCAEPFNLNFILYLGWNEGLEPLTEVPNFLIIFITID